MVAGTRRVSVFSETVRLPVLSFALYVRDSITALWTRLPVEHGPTRPQLLPAYPEG